jgi:hypothetical protein
MKVHEVHGAYFVFAYPHPGSPKVIPLSAKGYNGELRESGVFYCSEPRQVYLVKGSGNKKGEASIVSF